MFRTVRIHDGLFLGDKYSSTDQRLLDMNQVTHIVNCAGGEVPNAFENRGEMFYLTFCWGRAGSGDTAETFTSE
jgi:hypothetical protein